MKKICVNKSDPYILYGISTTVFFVVILFGITTLFIKDELLSYIIFGIMFPSSILLTILTTLLLSKEYLKKYAKYIEIDKQKIVYDNNLTIPIFLIKKIVYKKERNEAKTLWFYMANDNIDKIILSKRVVKLLQKEINIKIEYDLKIPKVPFKQKIKELYTSLNKKIKEYKRIIIFAIIGLGLTIISFILHARFNKNVILDIILALITFTYGIIQFYYAYFSKTDFDKFEKIFFSIGSAILFIVIVSLLILIGMCVMLDLSATIYILLWSCFLIPSFIIVVGIVILLMVGISYS